MKRLKVRLVSLVAIALLFVSVIPKSAVFAAWDGYKGETQTDNTKVILFDTNDVDQIFETVAVPSQKHLQNTAYSARWTNHASTRDFTIPGVPMDWSNFESIEFDVYSAAPTNAVISAYIGCIHNVGAPAKESYYTALFTIDWTGWKHFKLDFKNDFRCNHEAKLTEVMTFKFSTQDGGGTLNEDTDLYFESVVANLYDKEKIAETEELYNKVTKGTVGLFDNVRFMLKDGVQIPFDKNDFLPRTLSNKDIPYVSPAFFKNIGASYAENGNSYTVKIGQNTLVFSDNSSTYIFNGEERQISGAIFKSDSFTYFPVPEIAAAMGLSVKRYGYFTFIAPQESIDVLDNNPEILEMCEERTASYFPEPDEITDEDIRILQRRWVKTLVGDKNNDLSNPYIAVWVKNIEEKGRTSWSQLNSNEDVEKYFSLFGTSRVTSSDNFSSQAGKIVNMAKAWGTYGSALYHNEELLKDIKRALELFYNYFYGQDELDGCGWMKTTQSNWYSWYKSTARSISDILMILGDNVSLEDKRRYLVIPVALRKTMRTTNTVSASLSRLVGFQVGLAAENRDILSEIPKDFDVYLGPQTDKNGYNEDFGYIFHTHFAYASGYGVNQLVNITEYLNCFKGTHLELMSRYKNRIPDFIYNTYVPSTRNGRLMIMFGGRNIGFKDDSDSGANLIESILNAIGSYSDEDDYKLKTIVKSYINEDNISYVCGLLTVDNIQRLMNIMNDDNIKPLDDYEDCRVYWSCDRVVQYRPGYSVGIALSSKRMANYESVNGDNLKGWFISDGALYIYNDSKNKQFDNIYYDGVAFEKYPGTTEDTNPREKVAITLGRSYHPDPTFVGGAQVYNKYAVVAMDFEAFNNTTIGQQASGAHGGGQPYRKSTLTAHKSWFLFDNEVVCLGADITANDGFPVNTYVDNRLLYKNGEVFGMEDIVVDGTKLEKVNAYTKDYNNVNWIFVETEGGYYFPGGQKLTVNKVYVDKPYKEGACGEIEASYLELIAPHGVSPKQEDYAYVVLPNMSAEQTENYYKNPDIEVLANTPFVQAVREKKIGHTGYIFWSAGTFDGITTDKQLVINAEETDTEYILHIADPTQLLQNAKIRIDRDLQFVSADDHITVEKIGNASEINIKFSEYKGHTLVVKFKK